MIVNNIKLPFGYIQLDYIENDGTSYIDTGVNADNKLDIEIKFKALFGVNYYWGAILQNPAGEGYVRHHFSSTSNLKNINYNFNSYSIVKNDFDADKVHILKVLLTKNIIELDEDVFSINSGVFDTGMSYWLFRRNSNSASLKYKCGTRIYSCKMFYNGELVRNFIPCINPNNEIGLYDLVEENFYGNMDGNSSFIAGNQVIKMVDCIQDGFTIQRIYKNNQIIYGLPSQYTKVDCVKNPSTAYINTEYKPNNNTRIELDFKMNTIQETTNVYPLFGGRNGTTLNVFALWISGNFDILYPHYGNASHTDNGTMNVDFELNKRYHISFNKNVLKVNDKTIVCTDYTFQSNSKLCLFALCNNGGLDGRRTMYSIYHCKIYENNILIRNFIPCKNNENKYGLYDLVEGKFYQSANEIGLEEG